MRRHRLLPAGRLGRLVTVLAATGAVCATAVVVGTTAQADSGSGGDRDTVLRADTLAGLPFEFTGSQAPIRELNGGGLPWSIEDGDVRLRADGTLRVDVEGLVLADHPSVAPERRLTNPVAQFRAVVSCLTVVAGAPDVVNVASDPFAASPEGDAKARVQLDLPSPCLAPIVFVTSPNLGWFAVTGFDG